MEQMIFCIIQMNNMMKMTRVDEVYPLIADIVELYAARVQEYRCHSQIFISEQSMKMLQGW